MSIADPFVRWISDERGAPLGFSCEDGTVGSISIYPEGPDDPMGGVTTGSAELRHQAATYALTTTPTVLNPDTLVSQTGLVKWDTATGEITTLADAVYTVAVMCNASSDNQRTLYFSADVDTGAGFVMQRWSARQSRVTANAAHQNIFVSANRFPKGTRIRLYLWASSALNLVTEDLPGFAGQLTVPAVRLLITGSR